MRNRNKILMIVVSLLLCLTLISSCFVSSIYARFLKKSTHSTTVSFKKFDITVDVNTDFPNTARVTVVDDQTTLKNTNEYITKVIQIQNLRMTPGDVYNNDVQFTFSGTPSVDVNVIIDVDVAYTSDDFKVPSGVGGLTAAETIYFPINLTYGRKVGNTWTRCGAHTTSRITAIGADVWGDNYIEQQYMTQVNNYFRNPHTNAQGTLDTSTADYSSTWTFEKGKEVYFTDSSNNSITGIAFGFEWPLDYTTSSNNTNWNLRETHIANNEPTLTVTFSVTIEQKTNS